MKMMNYCYMKQNMDKSYKYNTEQSQTQKDTCSMILFILSSRTDKINSGKNQISG